MTAAQLCNRPGLQAGTSALPAPDDNEDSFMGKKIVLTGGGTAGHVTPNIALMPTLKSLGYEISYIGSYNGIEKTLITEQGIPYSGIDSGKLRRYFDWKNFSDPFRVVHGYFQARSILKRTRPDLVFSKGGFVSVPVVRAAASLHIPTIIHESDMTPGLANKLAIPAAWKVCCSFPETLKYLPADKAVLSGSPVRQELFSGSRQAALSFTGLPDDERPTLLVMGGSQGAASINKALRRILPDLLREAKVIHLCGKGNLDASCENLSGYVQYEYIEGELKDLFALCDFVLSRSGANSICELLALRKPSLLIPLPAASSRGDQILNARSYEKQGYSMVLEEKDLTPEKLLACLKDLYENRQSYIDAMNKSDQSKAISVICGLIQQAAGMSGS